jgi:hypothetical protein
LVLETGQDLERQVPELRGNVEPQPQRKPVVLCDAGAPFRAFADLLGDDASEPRAEVGERPATLCRLRTALEVLLQQTLEVLLEAVRRSELEGGGGRCRPVGERQIALVTGPVDSQSQLLVLAHRSSSL